MPSCLAHVARPRGCETREDGGVRTDELEYDLPAELIAQQPARAARRVAAARLLARDRRGAPRRGSATCRTSFRPGRSTVVNDTRVVPARIPIERPRGEVLLLERARRRRVGGARAADAPAARGPDATGRSSCSSTSARGAGGCGSTASRRARRRCRRTSPSRSATPSGTRRSTRAVAGLGRRADRRPPLHAGGARAARRRARDARTSASTRSGRSRRTTLEEHAIHGERYEVAAGRVGADPRRGARARRRDDDRARARDAGPRRAARRPDRALRHAGLRVPPRRLPPDELPPAALDAARARDGVRGRRGDAPPLPRSRSRSGTASTPSATRC